MAAERDRIAAEHDDAPPVPVTRPAPRTGRPGAPLWRLALAGDDLDAYLLPLPPHRRPTGATLADVLTPEEQDDVPAARITEVLTSVALADVTTPAAAPVTIGVDGRYAQGISAGRFAKVSCEYIGATARAARRAARVSECDRLVAVIARQSGRCRSTGSTTPPKR
ncbi:hypothetical protein [Verrucosispora sioxanthis]|uniref:hypothetical protein n=1 Tax=Verrucosispora sioxanthis TaxID=2499994 RepID=UPI00209FD399|nr:hypothetical protein [Verrucosispora sioxanthis]